MFLPDLPAGVTGVSGVTLYSDRERTLNPQTPPVALVGERWEVDTLNVPAGRWWGTVTAEKAGAPYSYPLSQPVDLPEDDRLAISPEALAASMRIPLPLSDDQRDILTQAIIDAQSDVDAYLGQPVMPILHTQKGVWPIGGDWDLCASDFDVIEVVSATPEVDPLLGALDTYTVTYYAGLNARDSEECEPIRRYLRAHAANLPEAARLWEVVVNPPKTIKSASTQGQSVSFEKASQGGGGAAGSKVPGSLPTLSSLDRWRIAGRRVHQGATQYGRRYYGA